ncbi:hypothetical protein FB446DRAFT_365525 [Lentinula raphanica]|nr:hypothetical protein FB446DRAFT_365525 [Lentinula raphanica]
MKGIQVGDISDFIRRGASGDFLRYFIFSRWLSWILTFFYCLCCSDGLNTAHMLSNRLYRSFFVCLSCMEIYLSHKVRSSPAFVCSLSFLFSMPFVSTVSFIFDYSPHSFSALHAFL